MASETTSGERYSFLEAVEDDDHAWSSGIDAIGQWVGSVLTSIAAGADFISIFDTIPEWVS